MCGISFINISLSSQKYYDANIKKKKKSKELFPSKEMIYYFFMTKSWNNVVCWEHVTNYIIKI